MYLIMLPEIYLLILFRLQGVVSSELRFQNLNATLSVESSSALGELVFTLTTNDGHFHHYDVILKTDSKYFEPNPTDQRKIVVKACLPAGFTEVLEFSTDDRHHVQNDNNILTINILPVAPVYNLPLRTVVPVDWLPLDVPRIIIVLPITFSNTGKCTLFQCNVTCTNDEKHFWIEEDTILIRTFVRDLVFDFVYELKITCSDASGVYFIPSSVSEINIHAIFTDTYSWKNESLAASNGGEDALRFQTNSDIRSANYYDNPYGNHGNRPSGEDTIMLDKFDADRAVLKRHKRAVTTSAPGSNVGNNVITIKPRCFCSNSVPRPGPNGFFIRKYRPVRVTQVTVLAATTTTMTSTLTSDVTSAADTAPSTTDTAAETSTQFTSSFTSSSMPTTAVTSTNASTTQAITANSVTVGTSKLTSSVQRASTETAQITNTVNLTTTETTFSLTSNELPTTKPIRTTTSKEPTDATQLTTSNEYSTTDVTQLTTSGERKTTDATQMTTSYVPIATEPAKMTTQTVSLSATETAKMTTTNEHTITKLTHQPTSDVLTTTDQAQLTTSDEHTTTKTSTQPHTSSHQPTNQGGTTDILHAVTPGPGFFEDWTNLWAIVGGGGGIAVIGLIASVVYKAVLVKQCRSASVGTGSTGDGNNLRYIGDSSEPVHSGDTTTSSTATLVTNEGGLTPVGS